MEPSSSSGSSGYVMPQVARMPATMSPPRVIDVRKLLKDGDFDSLVEAGLLVAGTDASEAALLLRRACELRPKHENACVHVFLARHEKDKKLQIHHAERQAQLLPKDPFSWLLLGNTLDNDGDIKAALDAYRKGIESSPGVYTNVVSACRMLQKLEREDEELRLAEEAVARGCLMHRWQRPSHLVYGLKAQAWWDEVSTWRAARILESNFKMIQEEILDLFHGGAMLKHGISDTENLTSKGNWTELNLIFNAAKNADLCPKTVELIEREIPEAASMIRGATKVSVLKPGTVVRPHNGPSNVRMRMHLGIRVPEGSFIRAGEPGEEANTRRWVEGKCLAFDDSFRHEVWHEGTEPRIVIIMDVWHPEMDHQARIKACDSNLNLQRYLARYSIAQQTVGWT